MTDDRLPQLPHDPGVYLMRDAAARILYIGKARDLKKRVASYFRHGSGPLDARELRMQAMLGLVRHVDYVVTTSEREALVLERRLINEHKPDFNVMWKDDKTYPFIALTWGEDFPRVFITREKAPKGAIRFGPYPNVSGVRSLLKWAWRKRVFPLRPCELEIEEGKPWPYEKVKSCLYLHTEQCPAPCVGRISKADYRKIAERARLFFAGRHDEMVARWEAEMAAHAKAARFEEAAQARDLIRAVGHMREQVTVRELAPENLDMRVRETRAIQEVTQALGLKKPAERIECFDISHMQGVEKVASMVSFHHGRPDKANYRKFIIRTVQGIDDFKSMGEAVARRYRRLKAEKKPLPDLVLIDGGKGQLAAALRAVTEAGMPSLPLAALAKEEEELFIPGRSESIRLAMDSAGLLLLRHVRDEAHRFAVTFHRNRRHKLALSEAIGVVRKGKRTP